MAKERGKSATQERILAAAEEHFGRRGYRRTTIEAIAAGTDVATGRSYCRRLEYRYQELTGLVQLYGGLAAVIALVGNPIPAAIVGVGAIAAAFEMIRNANERESLGC